MLSVGWESVQLWFFAVSGGWMMIRMRVCLRCGSRRGNEHDTERSGMRTYRKFGNYLESAEKIVDEARTEFGDELFF